MLSWTDVKFVDLLIESKDGEWGKDIEAVGLEQAEVIRGTDFCKLYAPGTNLPLRWIGKEILARKRLYPGDIILETAGGTATQSTGRSSLLKKSFFLYHNQKSILCSSFSRYLKIKKNEYNPNFLYYLLQVLYEKGYMRVFNIQHTGVSRFQYTTFKNKTVLKIPPLPIQKKIAAVLSAYDDLIENNNRRIAILEKMAEEIYREWFVRMRFPGHEKVKFHKGVPDGWETVKTDKAFCFTGGGTPSKMIKRYWDNGNINWYTPSDITAANCIYLFESQERCTEEGLDKSSSKLFPPYSIMMTSRATIGALGINTTSACTNQGFITCIPNERYPLTFLYHWLKLNKSFFELLSSGATFSELTKSTFRRILILTPPKNLVDKFQEIAGPLFSKIQVLLKSVIILKKSRALLLPRLISGKLSVEDLNIKFPPSMEEEESDA